MAGDRVASRGTANAPVAFMASPSLKLVRQVAKTAVEATNVAPHEARKATTILNKILGTLPKKQRLLAISPKNAEWLSRRTAYAVGVAEGGAQWASGGKKSVGNSFRAALRQAEKYAKDLRPIT